MSALSPAPAPISGVRWTDLPTPLDSALPSCCLSYKQSAFWSPLCFHNLTNCFFGNSFVFKNICVAPWCFPRRLQNFGFLSLAMLWRANVFNSLQPLACPEPRRVHSWASFLHSCRLFSEAYSLFLQNTGGGGGRVSLILATRLPREKARGHFTLPLGSRSNA